MKKYQVALATVALVMASAGPVLADGPGGEYGAAKSGLELRTTGSRLLKDIHEGMQVKVDYTANGDTNEINSIEPVADDTTVGVRPTGVGGSGYHG